MTEPDSFLPLPHLSFHVLVALAEGGPMHGWAVIKRIGELTDERATPSSGSLYLAMVRMEERGLLEETPRPSDDEDARRRYYDLSPLGRRVLEAESERLAGLVEVARASRVVGGED